MNFVINSLIATPFVLLILQASVSSGFLQSFFDSNRPNGTHFGSGNQSSFGNYSTNFEHTIHRPNFTSKVNDSAARKPFHRHNDNLSELIDGADRQKRDIRNDILESELQMVVKAYNSEISSQTKTALTSIISRSDGLNDLRNLLTFSFNNLATSGLNDLTSMASKLPITIQNCYNSYGFKFSDAISVSKMKAGQCLSNKINEAKSIAQDFRESFTNAVANLRDVTQQITQCQILANLYPSIAGLIAKASCLNIAIFSIRGETVLLPLKFATLLGQSFNSILTIQSDMNKCGLEIVNTILDQSIQSGRAINNCINEQNGATNSTLFTGSSGLINTTPSPVYS